MEVFYRSDSFPHNRLLSAVESFRLRREEGFYFCPTITGRKRTPKPGLVDFDNGEGADVGACVSQLP